MLEGGRAPAASNNVSSSTFIVLNAPEVVRR